MKSGNIAGINPSIAKLIYLLNFWGAETFESHAGFYPGDPEEQEYWAQKIEAEEEHGFKAEGPVLLLGGLFRLPGGHIILRKKDVSKLEKILPLYWKLNTPDRHIYRETSSTIAYELDYEHPEFLKFQQAWDELYYMVSERFGITDDNELSRFEEGTWQKINELIVSHLPLNQVEFNEIRDKGIKELEKKLFASIQTFDKERYKWLVDKFMHDLNLAKGGDLSYFH